MPTLRQLLICFPSVQCAGRERTGGVYSRARQSLRKGAGQGHVLQWPLTLIWFPSGSRTRPPRWSSYGFPTGVWPLHIYVHSTVYIYVIEYNKPIAPGRHVQSLQQIEEAMHTVQVFKTATDTQICTFTTPIILPRQLLQDTTRTRYGYYSGNI